MRRIRNLSIVLLSQILAGCLLSSTVSLPDIRSPWPNSSAGWKPRVGSVLVHDIEMRQGEQFRRGLMVTRILTDTTIDGDPASVASIVGYFADSGYPAIWRESTTAIYAYHPEGIFEYDRKDYWPNLYPAGLFRAAARTPDTAKFGYAANILAYPMARASGWEGMDSSYFPSIPQVDFRQLADTTIRTGEGLSRCVVIRGQYRAGNVVFDRWIDSAGLAKSRYDWMAYYRIDGTNELDSVPGWATAVRISTDTAEVDTLRSQFFQSILGEEAISRP